ncbi:MAG TPA: HU family DNA-binding protein [Rhodothermales bacterium]|nr:HU family DNA-binding protein [Rhodothermales bacterium]
MPTPSQEQVASALADVIGEVLRKGQDVRVPGLGTFRIHHQVSQVERSADGEIVMKPPKDVIAFAADK